MSGGRDDVFAGARAVADAVLFEGYVLYPYRASSRKNQFRWQWGVLMPPARAGARGGGEGESDRQRTACLLEPRSADRLEAELRFLRVSRRTVEATGDDGRTYRPVPELALPDRILTPWDEGREERVRLHLKLAELAGPDAAASTVHFDLGAEEDREDVVDPHGRLVGRLVRRSGRITGEIRPALAQPPGPYRVVRITVDVRNTTPTTADGGGDRDGALPHALVATHLMLAAPGGRFVSLTDPPQWAEGAVRACREANEGVWPVLAGPPGSADTVLASPIILADHPSVAPESPGALYDATEIDEILALRTAALTDEEKREARGTDARAAGAVDLADTLPPELMARLHGTIRELRSATGDTATGGTATGAACTGWSGTGDDIDHDTGRPGPAGLSLPETPGAPWWDPARDAEAAEDVLASVIVDGVPVGPGSRVRLTPGLRRSDAQDIFLAGRLATVEAVLRDIDGETHLAVVVDGDPGGDVRREQGRFLYFRPDEVTPATTGGGT